MKFFKSILIVALMTSATAIAQNSEPVISEALVAEYNGVTSEETAKAQTEEMKAYLNLSDEQYNNVYHLNLKVADKINAIKANEALDAERKKLYIEGNLKDRHNAMSQILTAEQFELFHTTEYQ